MNRFHGLSGTFWERESFTAPELEGDDELLDRCVYVLTNACTANLVERPEDWTGITSWSLDYGQVMVVPRPDFFSDSMPAELEIQLVRPLAMPELDDAQLRQEVRRRAHERALELAIERRKAKTQVLGMSRVARQSISDSPRRPPTTANDGARATTRSRWSLIAVAQRSHEWVRQYREALRAWIKNHADGVFPCGTYLMRVRYRAACAPP